MDTAALSCLAEQSGWELLTLFGSRARGTERCDSDYDLAILPGLGSHKTESVLSVLGTGEVDVVWLNDASWLLSQEIAKDGQLLYERRPGAWAEFCSEAQLRAWDSEIWRKRTRRFVERSLREDWQLNRDLVERKAALLAQYLRELKPILELDRQRFISDPMVHHAAERLLELLVECAGSINNEASQALVGIPPSDYYSSFFSMVSTGWLGQETAVALGQCARIRNTLVHRYESVGLDEFHQQLLDSVPFWQQYLRSIVQGLNPS